jgi:hypothetical protein
LGYVHRPLTAICTVFLGSFNEREHFLSLGSALDDAQDGNDFAGIVAGLAASEYTPVNAGLSFNIAARWPRRSSRLMLG